MHIKKIFTGIILCLFIHLLFSIQVSGQTLSGSYTIGGSSPDYSTLTTAVSALTTNGVSGPVVFNIRAGTYTEQISIGAISGVSSTNTITFQPEASASVTIDYTPTSSYNYVIKFNGADYITLQNLTLRANGTNYGTVLDFASGSDYITIDNNTINGLAISSTATSLSVIYSASNTSNNNISITNNSINNGSYALYFHGYSSSSLETGNEISGNIIDNYSYCGMDLYYQEAINVSSNEITAMPSGGFSYNYGIYCEYCDQACSFTQNAIQVYGSFRNYGLYLNYCDGNSSNKILVSNNTIVNQNSPSYSYGITYNVCTYVNTYYNSVNITDGNSSVGVAISLVNGSYHELLNNIFANTKSGGGYAIYTNTSGNITTSDYNDLYAAGSYLGFWAGSSKSSLALWQSGSSKDINSVSADPGFVSTTDLHLSSTSSSCYQNATPISGQSEDFDGDSRDASIPDIGADEFYLSGTYTIGGSSPDYSTITDAISHLTSIGISGPVVFNIRMGTYTEQISIGAISGASSTNTITFQPEASASVTIDYTPTSSYNYVIKFNGADYITFQDLTLRANGTDYGTVLDFASGSDYITIDNNTIDGVTGLSNATWRSVIYSASNTSNNNISITNNSINNGSYALYFHGYSSSSLETGNEISGNIIDNYSYCGMDLYYQEAINVNSNEITSMLSGGFSYKYGIYGEYCDKACAFSQNAIQVYGSYRNYGLYLNYCDGNSSNKILVSNNTIVNQSSTTYSYGITYNVCTYVNTYYNSINITDGNSSVGVAISMLNGSYHELLNNIFANTKSGGGYAIYTNTSGNITTSDYNDLYAAGSYLGFWAGSSKSSLALWQSGSSKDINSVSADPGFASTTDLHIYNSSSLCLQNGTSIAGNTEDFDGNTRDVSNPDIGADEVTYNEWDGSSSTDWNTAANWTNNSVPDANETATIPSSPANQPVIGSTPSNAAGGLIIEEGASLTINSGTELTVNDLFLIRSNSTASGSLINKGSLTLNTENNYAYVERYITGGTLGVKNGINHFISSPISNANFNHLYDTDLGGFNIYEYIPGTGFSKVFDGDLTVGKGYLVAYNSDKNLCFNGVLNDGTLATTISITNDDWNLIGNPYPSSISANLFINENLSTASRNWIQGTLYFWNQSSTFDGGDYASHNGSGGTASSNIPGTTPNGSIASGQAFFVKSGTGGSTSCNFTNSMRTAPNTQFFTSENNSIQKCWINITDSSGNYNEVLISFLEEASKGFDALYDGEKLNGNPNISLYTLMDGNTYEYVIQGRPYIENEDVVKLGLYSKEDGLYTIKLKDLKNFDQDIEVILVDLLENNTIKLKQQDSYETHISRGDNRNRFEIHFLRNSTTDTDNKNQDVTSAHIYSYDKKIYFDFPMENLYKVQIFDITGREVYKNTFSGGFQSVNPSLQKGYYLVRLSSENTELTTKLFYN